MRSTTLRDDVPLEDALDTATADSASVEVLVNNPHGLHLRPATEFARIAQATGCSVRVRCGDREGDGASVLELAMMAIGPGARLLIEVRGPACEEAVRELAAAVGREFPN